MSIWRRFALTASYITCFPLTKISSETPDSDLQGLAKYLPAAGLFIGLLLAALAWFVSLWQVGGILSGTLLTLCWLSFTGGIHLDGLMDAADGIFSHRDRPRMLEIMNDSRVGNFGVMMGVGNLLLKIACLSTLTYPLLLAALILVPCWARLCETLAIGRFPYLRSSGMGKIWHDSIKVPGDLYLATIVPVLSLFLLSYLGWKLLLLTAFSVLLGGLWAAALINKILGGHTGDTYGATVELAETSGLLLLTIVSQSILGHCLY